MMFLLQIADSTNLDGLSLDTTLFKTIFAMIFVVALAVVFLKYVLPLLTGHHKKKNSSIEILDYQILNGRKMIYVLKIEDKKVAVAVSEQNVTKLLEWDSQNVS